MVIQLQSLKIGIRSCAAQKVPPGSKTYKDLMHLQGSKQVASPEAGLFPRPPFMCFMQTFSKCTTISCISRDKTNGFSFSYEGVVEGRSRESTGKAFAAPVDRPPLSLTHHLTPQMCPFSTSQGGNLAIFGSKYKSLSPVVLRIRNMWILAAPVDILTHHLTPQMCPLQHPKTKVTHRSVNCEWDCHSGESER